MTHFASLFVFLLCFLFLSFFLNRVKFLFTFQERRGAWCGEIHQPVCFQMFFSGIKYSL